MARVCEGVAQAGALLVDAALADGRGDVFPGDTGPHQIYPGAGRALASGHGGLYHFVLRIDTFSHYWAVHRQCQNGKGVESHRLHHAHDAGHPGVV